MYLSKWVPEAALEPLRRSRAALRSVGLPTGDPFDLPADAQAASSKLTVVVPIHDAFDMTARCLSSLRRFGGQAEIVLVDDGSNDERMDEFLSGCAQKYGWKHLRHAEARGHSRACEAGSGAATRPYLCLLNSDTVVTPWSWQAPVDVLDRLDDVAVVGPSTSWASGQQQVERACQCRNYWSDRQIFAFAKQYTSQQEPRAEQEVSEATGFAFFVRKAVFDEFGGFHQNLTDYGNETELCHRLRSSGWRIIWTRNAYVHHFGQQSYGRLSRSERVRRAQVAYSLIEGSS
ncbi:MAG: glycosyltransferase [bacterium]|nr:glycosyltransferase [bacterium]